MAQIYFSSHCYCLLLIITQCSSLVYSLCSFGTIAMPFNFQPTIFSAKMQYNRPCKYSRPCLCGTWSYMFTSIELPALKSLFRWGLDNFRDLQHSIDSKHRFWKGFYLDVHVTVSAAAKTHVAIDKFHYSMKQNIVNLNKGLRPATSLKKRLWRRCFTANSVKFLRTHFFTEHLRWLLL